ncbi:MAG: aminotransferase class V-fold PLP-dependent enzyme [Bdellovibrionales bacterium]
MSFEREMERLFPQLQVPIHDQRLIYLDSAATTLKPRTVIETIQQHMMREVANVHRGAHWLSDQATEKFEAVRQKAAKFLGADSPNEIIFTRGTTEGLNLLANSLGKMILNEGDEILLSQMEHHSNIVPWQLIAAERKALVRFIPVKDDGTLDLEAASKLLTSGRVKILSLVHLSNAIGTLNPISSLLKQAHALGIRTVVDAAQSAAAIPIRVKELNADFLVLSGHKVFGPTGVGVLYGQEELLNAMPPYQGGGSMIEDVSESGSTYLPAPHRFEAGTPPIAEVMGLGAAFDFISELGFNAIAEHEKKLMATAEDVLAGVPNLRRIGQASERLNVVSFLMDGTHPSDLGSILDEQGIAIRTGHHCCQPLMKRFGITGTARASFSIYTKVEDIEELSDALIKAEELLL